ncbi:MAG TPA: hypothetical protein VJ248_05470 [Candidatus Udaeobacter sp.]|nr:hypothetical protein [Candidatus Udaeobacter sp.]
MVIQSRGVDAGACDHTAIAGRFGLFLIAPGQNALDFLAILADDPNRFADKRFRFLEINRTGIEIALATVFQNYSYKHLKLLWCISTLFLNLNNQNNLVLANFLAVRRFNRSTPDFFDHFLAAHFYILTGYKLTKYSCARKKTISPPLLAICFSAANRVLKTFTVILFPLITKVFIS